MSETVIQDVVIPEEETTTVEAVTVIEETPPTEDVIRTAFHGTFEVYDGAWGSYLRPCADPMANAEVTKENLKHFELREDIHRIPADLWARWKDLCFYFVDKVPSNLEVSIRFLRSSEDPSQYRIIVPRQKVTAASVRADNFDECIDIETGEEFTSYPPEGWIPVGSSHSHNTMNAFFSGTDDKYELDDPGIHLTVGKINVATGRYEIAASVVGNRRRFIVHFENLIDATPVEGVTYHPNVLKYVDWTTPAWASYNKRSSYVKPVTTNILKRLPPAKEIKTYDSIDEYYRDKYGDRWGDFDNDNAGEVDFYNTYPNHENWKERARRTSRFNDPFFVSEGGFLEPSTTVVEDIYPIVDLLNDYFKDNRHDTEAIEEMKQSLHAFLIEVELELTEK